MAKFGKQELWQAISCVLCIAVAWVHLDDVGASEFSGGRVTGPLFAMADNGSLLFIPALVLTVFYRRIAAVLGLMASILCLPLYLYFTSPEPFRWVVKGEYSVPLRANFVWNNWAIAGIASLLFATIVCLRRFIAAAPKIDPMRESSESG